MAKRLSLDERSLIAQRLNANFQPQAPYHDIIFLWNYLLYRITRIARFARPQNLHTITSPSNSIPTFQKHFWQPSLRRSAMLKDADPKFR